MKAMTFQIVHSNQCPIYSCDKIATFLEQKASLIKKIEFGSQFTNTDLSNFDKRCTSLETEILRAKLLIFQQQYFWPSPIF